jgi:phosphatidylglycerol:prolipoprotein diacylglycerol transferase
MIGYGTVRFFIEYFRAPDENLGYILALGKQSDNIALFQSFFNFSMGQLFCLAMIICGIVFARVLRKKGALHVSHR